MTPIKKLVLWIALIYALLACNMAATVYNELAAPIPAPQTIRLEATPTTVIRVNDSTAFTESGRPTPLPLPTRVHDGSPEQRNVYELKQLGPYPACSVSPAGPYDVNIRVSPSTSGEMVGSLRAGTWVAARQMVDDWYQIVYPGTPVDNGWVAGRVTTLTPPCACDPNCAVQIEPESQVRAP